MGGAIAQLAAYSAFEQSNLGYVTAVMKLSGLFTVIIGGLFLKEKTIKEKFLGATIMLAGVALVVI